MKRGIKQTQRSLLFIYINFANQSIIKGIRQEQTFNATVFSIPNQTHQPWEIFLELAPPNQDALRGLLSARFTAVELFRSATAESSESNATVGMDDLDELLLRSNLTLPLEVWKVRGQLDAVRF